MTEQINVWYNVGGQSVLGIFIFELKFALPLTISADTLTGEAVLTGRALNLYRGV